MQPTNLAKVIQYAAGSYGKDPDCDRDFLVDKINQVRQAKWKNPNFRDLLFTRDGCECVVCYSDTCTKCHATYTGITLPQQVTAINYIEVNGNRIKVTNKALDNQGCCGTCGCNRSVQAEIEAVKAPLYRDIPDNYTGPVIFKCTEKKDEKKRVGVEYVNFRNGIVREDILLRTDGAATTNDVKRFLKVTLPERCGYVQVMTTDGWELGSYQPAVLSPSHLRIHINGVMRGDMIHWEGLAEPVEVMHDSDMVEYANKVDWLNDFMWLKMHFNENKSRGQMAAYESASLFAASSADSEVKATQATPLATLRPRGISGIARFSRGLNRGTRRWR